MIIDDLVNELKLTNSQKSELKSNYSKWEEYLKSFEEAIKRSEHITEEDLKIIITE